VIVNNVQLQIDQLHRQTLRQIYVPPPIGGGIDEMEEDGDHQNGRPQANTEEPYQGSSSSDSDSVIPLY